MTPSPQTGSGADAITPETLAAARARLDAAERTLLELPRRRAAILAGAATQPETMEAAAAELAAVDQEARTLPPAIELLQRRVMHVDDLLFPARQAARSLRAQNAAQRALALDREEAFERAAIASAHDRIAQANQRIDEILVSDLPAVSREKELAELSVARRHVVEDVAAADPFAPPARLAILPSVWHDAILAARARGINRAMFVVDETTGKLARLGAAVDGGDQVFMGGTPPAAFPLGA